MKFKGAEYFDDEPAEEEEEDDDTSEEEDEEEVKRGYGDALMFDVIKNRLPGAKAGRTVVLLSVALQTAMIILLFLGHHHKRKDFDCCNMYAVLCAVIFLLAQMAYFFDWSSIYGDNPAWHRANLFAPMIMYILMFVEWGLGTLSMLARAIELDLFAMRLGSLTRLELASFYICTISGGLIVIFCFVICYAHRNNLGQFYYLETETQNDVVELIDSPVPVQGSFNFRQLLFLFTRFMRVETSKKAKLNLPRLIIFVAFLQIPFYLFCSLTYASGNQSNVPIFFICMGIVGFVINFGYVFSACAPHAKRSRRWNRTNLLASVLTIYAVIACYFFTISSVLFKNEQNSEIWESIVPNLDRTEKTYFAINLTLILLLALVQIVITNIHRKGWCDGRKEIEVMLDSIQQNRGTILSREALSGPLPPVAEAPEKKGSDRAINAGSPKRKLAKKTDKLMSNPTTARSDGPDDDDDDDD